MSWSSRSLALALAFLAGMAGAAGVVLAQGTDSRPVVVELFTSQGCSSCPPADAFLGELAKRPGVIALGYHIDYWDYIGWKDPFANPAWTERQRAYKRALGRHMVYTPQMVIDGRVDATGSDRRAVDRGIAAAAQAEKIAVAIRREAAGRYWIALPDAMRDLPGLPATVLMAVFDRRHETPVKRGENAGATLTDYNVVRELRAIGQWSGDAVELPLEIDVAAMKGKACAILVQSRDDGPILGAGLIPDENSGG